MNEADINLLRAAVGIPISTVPTQPEVPSATQPAAVEPDLSDAANLPEDVLDDLLAQLQDGLPQQPKSEPVALHESVPADGDQAAAELHLDPNILEQISKALAWADGDSAATANNGPAQGAAGVAYADNPRNFPPPTRERTDNCVRRQQQQQQAGLLISNEIHRRLDSSDPRKAADRERIREENRERKKKWRESNQDRNKDNDLRCRVTKKAVRIFGRHPSVEKAAFIAQEFNKRKLKREQKEQARGGSVSGSPHAFYSPTHTLSGFGPSEQPPQPSMREMVQLVMGAPPEVFAGLCQIAAEISRMPPSQGSLAPQPQPQPQPQLQPRPPDPQPAQVDPAPPTQQPQEPQEPEGPEPLTVEEIFQRFAASGEVPEGFDLILAELAAGASKQPTPEPESALEPPKIPAGVGVDGVDELLAAIAAADSEAANGSDSTMSGTDENRLEDAAALVGPGLTDNGDFNMTEETLARIVNECGIGPPDAQPAPANEAAPEVKEEEPSVDIPSEMLEGMTIEQINELLGCLSNAEDSSPVAPSPPPPPPQRSLEPTPENVSAVLKTIFESILPAPSPSSPPPPPPPPPPTRPLPPPPPPPPPPSTRRPLPPQTPALPAQGSLDVHRPPDARGLTLKRPPYLPLPVPPHVGLGAGRLPLPLPPKPITGEEQRKIKAMGFPPMLAGIKRKADD